MTVSDMSHDNIADWCASRLKRLGYTFAFSNMTSAIHGEQPDVLGLTAYGKSIIVEVKMSRADFLADKKKPRRINPNIAMGDERVYLTPERLLNVSDIPYGWQLWEVYGKNKPKLRIVKGRMKKKVQHPDLSKGNLTTQIIDNNMTIEELFYFSTQERTHDIEFSWLLKIMGRAQDNGIDLNQFANNYQHAKN